MSSKQEPFEQIGDPRGGIAHGSLRDRIDGRKGLRRGRELCRARARILYRARGSAQSRGALPVITGPFSTAGGQTQPGCARGRTGGGNKRQRTGPRSLPGGCTVAHCAVELVVLT